jgi:hypothetical protein
VISLRKKIKMSWLLSLLVNWKTTLAGVGTLAGAIATVATTLSKGTLDQQTLTTLFSTVLAGIGLIAAKDSNVTGGTKVVPSVTPRSTPVPNPTGTGRG